MAFLELLVKKQKEAMFLTPVTITVIATGTRGLWRFKSETNTPNHTTGIAPEQLLNHLNSGGELSTLPGAISFDEDSTSLAKIGEYHVLIELSPLNIHSGHPAITHIEAALKRGLGVITANKGPIAFDFQRLNALSLQHQAPFLYETTVMDGTPIFNLVRDTLPHCKILEIEGILNSTTNFILDELSKGNHLDDILDEGRRRGFVEADPSMDIEGYDAAAKITALANVLMGANAVPSQVNRHGIAHISYGDIQVAKKTGHVIKLVCKASRREDQTIELTVAPEHIPIGHMFSGIPSTTSAITLTTDLMGQITIVEHNPEIEQTAFGIYQDLLRYCGIKGLL